MDTKWFAFYGSLRRGMFNHRIFGEWLRFENTTVLKGYKMFSLQDYPIAIKTGVESDVIIVELFEIANASVRNEIHELEVSAGYFYEIVRIDDKEVVLYLYKARGNNPEVVGGDWVKFFGSR